MKIWVDVDVCLVVVKEILYCVVNWVLVQVILVVNQFLSVFKFLYIVFVQVVFGFDIVDNEIVKWVELGDLVIISDIFLVVDVIEKGVLVLSFCGELFMVDNICG